MDRWNSAQPAGDGLMVLLFWAVVLIVALYVGYKIFGPKPKAKVKKEDFEHLEPEPPPDPHANCVDHVTYCVRRKD